MITEGDLDEAIAECMGQRNPNTNTCIKLAAYLIIKDHLYPQEEAIRGHSYAVGEESIPMAYEGDTELSEAIRGLSLADIMPVFEELMETLKILNRTLYDATLRRLSEL